MAKRQKRLSTVRVPAPPVAPAVRWPRRMGLVVVLAIVLLGAVGYLVHQSEHADQASQAPPQLATEYSSKPSEVVGTDFKEENDTGRSAVTPQLVTSANVSTAQSAKQSTALNDLLNPESVGWPTEAFSDATTEQLKKLAKFLAHPADMDVAKLQDLAVEHVTAGALRPTELNEVFRDSAIVVSRAADGATTDAGHQGLSGLAQALRKLAEPLGQAEQIRSKIKTVDVSLDGTSAATTAYFEVSGVIAEGSVQENATWICQWHLADRSTPPKLVSIASSGYEEVVVRAPHQTLLVDCTEHVIGDNVSFQRQLAYGLPYWLQRVELRNACNTFCRYGGAVGDVNGDGLEDLYICQPGGLPNLLFLQNLDGTVEDTSHAAGVDVLDCATSAIFSDLDNDGDQDLTVAVWFQLLIFENDGTGRFQQRAKLPTHVRDIQSLSATDYDNDGQNDLYITIDMRLGDTRAGEGTGVFVYTDANDGAPNILYRNEIAGSQWSFKDVTKACGLGQHNYRHSLAAAWEDYDNDGDMDLYVANDFGQNSLYRNDDGQFVDIAPAAGVVDHGSGMSASWGDYDRDGWMDLYVGNMFSSAGHRVTSQTSFKSGSDDTTRNLYRRMAKGNTLFRNLGDDTFEEITDAGVEMGRWSWSSLFADLNNDGREDLLVANGYITTEDTGDL